MERFIEMLITGLEGKKKGQEYLLWNAGDYLPQRNIHKYAIYCYESVIQMVKGLAEEHNKIQVSSLYGEFANSGWIPTSERLPEHDGYYLITFKGKVHEAYYQEDYWLDPIEFYGVYHNVTAWQPLPKPYKEV